MCLILTVTFIVAALSFFGQGLMPHAIISGFLASISLFFFIRKLIVNGRCIFGNDTDCNAKK